MTTKEVAEAFAALLKAGRDAEAQAHWADDVVSLEPMEGPMARCEGREALLAKHAWWSENFEVHEATTEGPWVHGDQFALRFSIDVTQKGGERLQMTEIGLYAVRDGKIVEERFFGP